MKIYDQHEKKTHEFIRGMNSRVDHKITDINYAPGSHVAFPKGEIKQSQSDILFFHFANMGIDYILKKKNARNQRQSETNKEYGFGIHYSLTDNERINKFLKNFSKSIKYEEINDQYLYHTL